MSEDKLTRNKVMTSGLLKCPNGHIGSIVSREASEGNPGIPQTLVGFHEKDGNIVCDECGAIVPPRNSN